MARAGIYRVLMRPPFAQTQAEVDDTELWVIATALGVGETEASDGTETIEQFDRTAEEFNRQRVLAAQGLAPPPEPPPTGEAIPDAMMEVFLRQRAERTASGGDPR